MSQENSERGREGGRRGRLTRYTNNRSKENQRRPVRGIKVLPDTVGPAYEAQGYVAILDI